MSNQLTNGEYSLTLDSLGAIQLPDGVGAFRSWNGVSVFMRDDDGPIGMGAAPGYNVYIDTSVGVAITAGGNGNEKTLQLAPNGDVNFPSGMVVSLLGGISSNATVIGHSNGIIVAVDANNFLSVIPGSGETRGVSLTSETTITLTSDQPTTILVNGNEWSFEEDGTTYLPGGTRINKVGDVSGFANDLGAALGTSNPNCVYVSPTDGVTINVEDPANLGTAITWNFSPDSSMMIPGGGRLYYDGANTTLGHELGICIATSGSNHIHLTNDEGASVHIANSASVLVLGAATFSGTTMTVTSITQGTLAAGQVVAGPLILQDTAIVGQLTGTAGSTGTYQVSIGQTVPDPSPFEAAFINLWKFGLDGRTTVPFNLSVPLMSQGAEGDKAGMTAFDNSYMYVCTADWVDNSPSPQPDIWSRVALDNTAFDYT